MEAIEGVWHLRKSAASRGSSGTGFRRSRRSAPAPSGHRRSP